MLLIRHDRVKAEHSGSLFRRCINVIHTHIEEIFFYLSPSSTVNLAQSRQQQNGNTTHTPSLVHTEEWTDRS